MIHFQGNRKYLQCDNKFSYLKLLQQIGIEDFSVNS